jgi:hypothetical protein
MGTAILERVQQEYQENIVDKVEVWLQKLHSKHQVTEKSVSSNRSALVYQQGLEETKDLAIVSAKAAGLDKEADRMEQCGKAYSMSRCNDCGDYIGHPYHCNERLCPICYYRNLFRFMKRHEKSWEDVTNFTLITISYGSYRPYDLEEAKAQVYQLHKSLIATFPLLDGGIYHREVKWDEEYHLWNIRYHYLLAAHVNYVFYITMALNGQALVEDYRSFVNYSAAQSYFIHHCCKYPADILLDYTKVAWYLGLMKRSKLIQGFGILYHVTGGFNRGSTDLKRRVCPACGGKLSYVGLTTRRYVVWDNKLKCYTVDPAAPVLPRVHCDR